MKVFVAITTAFLLLASLATAKEMTAEEITTALDKIAGLKNLPIVRADSYSDGSIFLILRYGDSNRGVKISRYEIKDLGKYLAPKKTAMKPEPEVKIVEKILQIPGPERIIEKKVEVPVKVPGPTRFIVREALPTIVIAGICFFGGRIVEDRYERSLEPQITKEVQPGHARVLIEYKGNDWLRRTSDLAYAAGGITLSIPVLRRVF